MKAFREPMYADVVVSTADDLGEPVYLITRVAAAMAKAGVPANEIRLFEDEAYEFTGYDNVLNTARYWVTVTS